MVGGDGDGFVRLSRLREADELTLSVLLAGWQLPHAGRASGNRQGCLSYILVEDVGPTVLVIM